jgi:predicted DNA-binding protein
MTPKKSVHIRLSNEGVRQLNELMNRLGETQEGVVRLALDRLYRDYSITDELKEIIRNGILVDGRFTMLDIDADE